MSAINDNYLNVQQDILETFIDRGELRKLAEPTVTATGKRIPGLKLDHPRAALKVAAGNTFTTADAPARHRRPRLPSRGLHARRAALRSLQAPGKGPHC